MSVSVEKLIRNWVFPRDRVCLACLRTLDYEETPDGILCRKCSEALGGLAYEQFLAESANKAPLPLNGLNYLHCAFPYQDQARLLILQLKYYHVRLAATPLMEAMKSLEIGNADLVLPIPTTRRRKWERGYNQVELIAEPLAKFHKIQYAPNLLRRIDDAESQTKVTPNERRTNIRGAMTASPKVFGRRVLLIDDVFTTGSTAAEAIRALNNAGCTSIGMLAVCRAGKKSDVVELPF